MTPHVITEDRPSFQRIAWATLVLVIVVGVIVIAVGWQASNAADNSSEVARGNEVAACRAQSRAAIDEADKTISVLVLRGLRAAALSDQETLREVAAASLPAEKALSSATQRYRRDVDLSVHDPATFLEECRR